MENISLPISQQIRQKEDLDQLYTLYTGRETPHSKWFMKTDTQKKKYLKQVLKNWHGIKMQDNTMANRAIAAKQRIQAKLIRKWREANEVK